MQNAHLTIAALAATATAIFIYAVPAGAATSTTQKTCSGQYQAAKSAGTLNGQKWPAFLSSCSDSIKGYSDQAQMAPPEPRTTAQVQPVTSRNATLPASGKTGLKSAGEVAFQQRIHECANEWKSEKSAGTLPAGSKWPQFWGQCNTQLKAQM